MEKIGADWLFKGTLAILLGVIGFFLMQTFATIKNLEKDIIMIREKISAFEATKLTRKDIMQMISDYHDHHPCINAIYKKEKKKKDEEDNF